MEKFYLVMNKPLNYVCSSVSDSHKTVYSLLPPEYQQLLDAKRGEKIHTVGRLDSLTQGLLIFTNDGEFSNHLTRPENHISKVYQVKLMHKVDDEQQQIYRNKLSEGVMLPPEKKAGAQKAGPAQIEFLNQEECLVTISEGKFHQVRRMFLALENQVISLKRIKIGGLQLPQNLPEGQFLRFSKEEISSFLFA